MDIRRREGPLTRSFGPIAKEGLQEMFVRRTLRSLDGLRISQERTRRARSSQAIPPTPDLRTRRVWRRGRMASDRETMRLFLAELMLFRRKAIARGTFSRRPARRWGCGGAILARRGWRIAAFDSGSRSPWLATALQLSPLGLQTRRLPDGLRDIQANGCVARIIHECPGCEERELRVRLSGRTRRRRGSSGKGRHQVLGPQGSRLGPSQSFRRGRPHDHILVHVVHQSNTWIFPEVDVAKRKAGSAVLQELPAATNCRPPSSNRGAEFILMWRNGTRRAPADGRTVERAFPRRPRRGWCLRRDYRMGYRGRGVARCCARGTDRHDVLFPTPDLEAANSLRQGKGNLPEWSIPPAKKAVSTREPLYRGNGGSSWNDSRRWRRSFKTQGGVAGSSQADQNAKRSPRSRPVLLTGSSRHSRSGKNDPPSEENEGEGDKRPARALTRNLI